MANAPDDRFETYFTEKIWSLIPAVYREEDGSAQAPGALSALVRVLAGQAAALRRSNDRLWDDQFIDLCNSWAVPYLADLLGTRLVSSLNTRATRIDVAKTIYYRRRKGTVRVLEELISDITGWEGVVREEFRRLARTWHGLDPKPAAFAGIFTGTLPGGYADLRRPRGSELAGGPFDEYFHSADVRLQRGRDGLYNIPKIVFHLYRLRAWHVTAVTSIQAPGQSDRSFTFDPSGRDVPLFSRRFRAEKYDWDMWQSALEWELPAPISCRVLGDPVSHDFLLGDSIVVPAVPPSSIVSANLNNWSAAAAGKELAIDPARGRMLFIGALPPAAAPSVSYYYGFSGPIGAGSYNRAASILKPDTQLSSQAPILAADIPQGSAGVVGVLELHDSSTFRSPANRTAILNTQIQAGDQERPYVRLTADWTLDATPNAGANLTLDGLWIGAEGNYSLILSGNYKAVTIRQATLDPGGGGVTTVPLVITGKVDTLTIDNSIVGPVILQGGSVGQCLVSDSILQSIAPVVPALNLPDSTIVVRRSTVFGSVTADRLDASEALFTGLVTIADTQDLCFRFSAAPVGSRVPHPYESHFIDYVQHYFTASSFGLPGFAQLSESAPPELLNGAENGSEIGAFSNMLNPIRLDGLRAKVSEYLPFGLIPAFLFET